MEVAIKKPKKAAAGHNVVLTYRQIRNRVGDGWAIIKDPEFNGAIFLKGELIYHSADRTKVLEEFGKSDERDVLLKYCGKPDPNTVFIL